MNVLSRTRFFLLVTVLSCFLGLSMASAQSYVWDSPEGQACFETWISDFTSTLNGFNGDECFNRLKPFGFSEYGHFLTSQVVSYRAPDDWETLFESNRYKRLWSPQNLSYVERPFREVAGFRFNKIIT